MKTLQVIVESTGVLKKDERLLKLGKIIHEIPMIKSYVLEIDESSLEKLKNLDCVKAVHKATKITAQMYNERKTVKVASAHKKGLKGKGIGIAILDTGISPVSDFTKEHNRIVAFKDVVSGKKKAYDDNGHGTHVAGIACGNGYKSNGRYMGIAPESDIIGVKILDKEGGGSSVDVLTGVQWVLDNHLKYNIKIVNLSVGAGSSSSKDPMVKAVEVLWDMGIIVVAAAGNNGPSKSSVTSPGISRKIITVGAVDDDNNVEIWGNDMVNFSGRGPTPDCIVKPDCLAPGTNIISCLIYPNVRNNEDDKIIDDHYLKLSGTSMATPIVTGAIALLLQKYPNITPNDVKLRLKNSCSCLGHDANRQGWGLLNIEKLLDGTSENLDTLTDMP